MSRGTLLGVAILALGGMAPLDAQIPDTLPRDSAAQPPPAAPAYVPPRFALSVTLGTLGFGTLQRQRVLATRVNSAGEALDSAVLNRAVEAERGLQLGVSGVFHIDRTWAVRLGVGVGRTTVRPEYKGEADLFTAAAGRLAATEASDATLMMLEAALRMRVPSVRRAQPYVEVGGTVMHWKAGAVAGTPKLDDGVQRMGAVAAAGVDVPLTERLAGRLQATSRVFRTPVDPAPAGMAGPGTSTMTLTFMRPETDPFADDSHELTTTLRLELGISLGIGGTVEALPDPAEPGASPSPTRR